VRKKSMIAISQQNERGGRGGGWTLGCLPDGEKRQKKGEKGGYYEKGKRGDAGAHSGRGRGNS